MTYTRPIIFSGPMVRALLDGRKTMTRRILKPQPFDYEGGIYSGRLIGPEWYEPAVYDHDGEMFPGQPIFGVYHPDADFGIKVPYAPGCLLWVRETWADVMSDPPEAVYRADGERPWSALPWRSPIHMPRWASRLTLEVTGVKVERLQEISEEDALAEGIGFPDGYPQQDFAEFWDSLNGKRPGCAWDDSPWVIAIAFTTHKRNVDDLLAEKAA